MTNNTLPLFTPAKTVPVAAQHQITATQVTDEHRISFWPQHFGSIPQWITIEPTVFAWMDRFCADYNGGIWQFYTLSNGGAFMAKCCRALPPSTGNPTSIAARFSHAGINH